MIRSKQEIIDAITAHIQKRGGDYSDWYVGVGAKGYDALFETHKVKEKGDRWILRRAESPAVAREVGGYFVSTLATGGPAKSDDLLADAVYAYRKAPHTRP